MRKKIKQMSIIFGIFIILSTGWLFASGTFHYMIPRGPGVTIGDILYVDRNDDMTNLTAGSTGTVLQSAGVATAPAYVAKNIFREAAIHNFATAAASWTLSADEILCNYLASTNANAAATIQGPATAGITFVLRNGSGQNNTIHTGSGTGITVATGTTVRVFYSGVYGDYLRIGTACTVP